MTPTILTRSGLQINLLRPDPACIHLEDIAHALGNLCRFTGHTRQFYSVAQHSVHVSHLVPPEHALAALLHDATEAYLGDVSSPLKHQLPAYREIEARMESAIATRFGLTLPLHPSIKAADLVALATEKRDLMAPDGEWDCLADTQADPVRIYPVSFPYESTLMFLSRYSEIANKPTPSSARGWK